MSASTYTVSGTTTGAATIPSPYTVTLGPGATSAPVTFTPTGAGLTFSPSTVTLSNPTGAWPMPSATFYWTAASTGSPTISLANNGGLTGTTSIPLTVVTGTAVNVGGTLPSGVVVNNGTGGGWAITAAGYYYLTANATSNGTGFIFCHSGVTLDGNGYTLKYNNATALVITNSGFESSNSGFPTGWTLVSGS